MIYSVQHFWSGDDEPTEYFLLANSRPSREDVVKALKINYSPEHDDIVVRSLDVVDLEKALRG